MFSVHPVQMYIQELHNARISTDYITNMFTACMKDMESTCKYEREREREGGSLFLFPWLFFQSQEKWVKFFNEDFEFFISICHQAKTQKGFLQNSNEVTRDNSDAKYMYLLIGICMGT